MCADHVTAYQGHNAALCGTLATSAASPIPGAASSISSLQAAPHGKTSANIQIYYFALEETQEVLVNSCSLLRFRPRPPTLSHLLPFLLFSSIRLHILSRNLYLLRPQQVSVDEMSRVGQVLSSSVKCPREGTRNRALMIDVKKRYLIETLIYVHVVLNL